MRFFVVSRDKAAGSIRLVTDSTFATRDEAVAALSEVAASGEHQTNDLFVVDLDLVTPVVIFPAPVPIVVPPVEDRIADVWEAPSEESSSADSGEPVAEPEPEPVVGSQDGSTDTVGMLEDEFRAGAVADRGVTWQVPSETPAEIADDTAVDAEGTALAEALRRAASALEDAGIVAPASLAEPEPSSHDVVEDTTSPDAAESDSDEAAVWPWESAVAEAIAADEAGPESAEGVGLAAGADPTPQPDQAVSSVDYAASVELEAPDARPGPMLDVVSLPDGVQEPVSVVGFPSRGSFEPVGLEEPGLEEITLLTPATGEDFSPRPVIVGDYPEEDGGGPTPNESAAEPSEPSEPTVQGDQGAGGFDELSLAVATAGAARAEAKPYEKGDTDLSAYTCEDCIYVGTCPKANQDIPATCGSFQWKSA
jgi:hypothetical protein